MGQATWIFVVISMCAAAGSVAACGTLLNLDEDDGKDDSPPSSPDGSVTDPTDADPNGEAGNDEAGSRADGGGDTRSDGGCLTEEQNCNAAADRCCTKGAAGSTLVCAPVINKCKVCVGLGTSNCLGPVNACCPSFVCGRPPGSAFSLCCRPINGDCTDGTECCSRVCTNKKCQ